MSTPQRPLPSGFGARTTAADVARGVDLSGKLAIVTGGASGIGHETVRQLTIAGAHVIVPARDPAKARDALAGIDGVAVAAMDLLDLNTIDAFVEGILASGRPVDILVAGAGVMAVPLTRDSRGYESQFSANHLGHFYLANRLKPALAAAGSARVVVLSSLAHRNNGLDLDDPNYCERPYDKWQAYAQSKTANALFALELDRRGRADGIRAFSVHPGAIQTGLQRHLTEADFLAFGMVKQADGTWQPGAGGMAFKTVEQGAATALWCATSPQLANQGGVYCEDCDIAVAMPADATAWSGVYPWAQDSDTAQRLWALSELLTGLSGT